MKPRIIVTGSRDWTDREALFRALNEATLRSDTDTEDTFITVVHGAARGADALASEWCRDRHAPWVHVTEEAHPADWEKHGKAAGPIRNSEMARLGGDLCLAFPKGGPGTWDMIRKANAAGIVVHVHPSKANR